MNSPPPVGNTPPLTTTDPKKWIKKCFIIGLDLPIIRSILSERRRDDSCFVFYMSTEQIYYFIIIFIYNFIYLFIIYKIWEHYTVKKIIQSKMNDYENSLRVTQKHPGYMGKSELLFAGIDVDDYTHHIMTLLVCRRWTYL
jgi:hypothetical protein